jgi:hypothetical protein
LVITKKRVQKHINPVPVEEFNYYLYFRFVMRLAIKKFSCIILMITGIVNHRAESQSIYHLKYRSPVAGDTTTYQALLIRYENGSGIVRISNAPSGAIHKFLAEMQVQEEYAIGDGNTIDTSVVKYKGIKTTTLSNTGRLKFIPVHFWFKLNADNNLFEPWAVSAATVNTAPAFSNFLMTEFKSSTELSKDFVLEFFKETDQFYNNLFGPRSKGGLLTGQEKASRLFLLVVASTNDEDIGPSCRIDAGKMLQLYSDVADFLGIRKVVDTVFGDRFSKAAVETAIKKLNPSSSDIVVFYYTGHGFSNPSFPAKKYSFLDLRDPRIRPRPNPREHSLNIEDIYNQIKSKGARLNLVIADCCNDNIEQTNLVGIPPPQQRSAGMKWNWSNVKTLFMSKQKLSFLITAATKGERATSKNNFGGFYSYYFLSSLVTYLGPDKTNPGWIQVLADAQKQTINRVSNMFCPRPGNPRNNCRQTPPPPKIN